MVRQQFFLSEQKYLFELRLARVVLRSMPFHKALSSETFENNLCVLTRTIATKYFNRSLTHLKNQELVITVTL